MTIFGLKYIETAAWNNIVHLLYSNQVLILCSNVAFGEKKKKLKILSSRTKILEQQKYFGYFNIY